MILESQKKRLHKWCNILGSIEEDGRKTKAIDKNSGGKCSSKIKSKWLENKVNCSLQRNPQQVVQKAKGTFPSSCIAFYLADIVSPFFFNRWVTPSAWKNTKLVTKAARYTSSFTYRTRAGRKIKQPPMQNFMTWWFSS